MTEHIKRIDVMKICEQYSQHCFNSNDSQGQDIADRILDDIVAIPTADVQEVKHGYWIEKEKGYTTNFGGKGKTPYRECSICGWDYPVVTVEQHFKQYKHCPNCGAKMDKEDNKNV